MPRFRLTLTMSGAIIALSLMCFCWTVIEKKRLKIVVLSYATCLCDDLYHTHASEPFNAYNSSLEGATELKFAPFCSS